VKKIDGKMINDIPKKGIQIFNGHKSAAQKIFLGRSEDFSRSVAQLKKKSPRRNVPLGKVKKGEQMVGGQPYFFGVTNCFCDQMVK
jgi:hypothetical protein